MKQTIVSFLFMTLFAAFLPVQANTGIQDKATVKGTVLDASTSKPVEFATVAIIMPDSTIVNGTTTDSTGAFTISGINEGEYGLLASFIGYRSITAKISISEGLNDIGEIYLEPDTEMLESAVITARRPVIEQKLDKLVMNVAEAVSTEGSNGSDILRKAPGVTIDFDGNVKLNGTSVAVWIDGRPSNLSGKELEVLLQSTDGTSIDRIEIMAHPSAKYDAAGGGGIINIVTKKNFMEGFNGSANLSYGGMYFDRYNQSANGSLNLNYRGKKTNTFLTYSGGYDDMSVGIESESLYGEDYGYSMLTKSDILFKSTNHMFRAGNDWYINDRNIFGVIVNGTFRNSTQESYGDSFTEHRHLSDLLSRQASTISNPSDFKNASANLNYTHTFDKTKMQELTLNADYSYFDIYNGSYQKDIFENIPGMTLPAGDSSMFRQDAGQKLQIWSAKADYQQVFWQTGLLEAGLKWSRTITDNNSIREDFLGGAWSRNDSLSNMFTYDEQIAAAYISAAKSFGQKWAVKIGLRGEYTFAAGDWKSHDSKTTKSYFNLFPTVFASYMPTQKWRIAASYTRRISRPGYNQLNPFRTYIGSNSYLEGNPDLGPQLSDQVSLTVGYGQHLNLSLMYMHNSSLIMQTPGVDPVSGVQSLVWENFGTQEIAGGSLSVSELPVFKWLTLSANYFAAYNSNTNTSGDYSSGSFMQSFYANLNFLLPKDWKIEFGGFGSGNMEVGYMKIKPMYMLNAGIKKNLWEGRGTLALNVQDLLRSMNTDIYSYTDGIRTYSISQRNNIQKVTLSFSYRFGQNKAVRRRNVGNVEETSRVSASSGISTGQEGGIGR